MSSNDVLLLHYVAERGRALVWVPDGQLPVAVGSEVRLDVVLEGMVGCDRIVRLLSPRALAQAGHVAPILESVRRVFPSKSDVRRA